jgi:hypothetical protein
MSFILSPVDTVDTITPKDFADNYLKPRRPLLIKGLSNNWPARINGRRIPKTNGWQQSGTTLR